MTEAEFLELDKDLRIRAKKIAGQIAECRQQHRGTLMRFVVAALRADDFNYTAGQISELVTIMGEPDANKKLHYEHPRQ